jgi:hypothetical protein
MRTRFLYHSTSFYLGASESSGSSFFAFLVAWMLRRKLFSSMPCEEQDGEFSSARNDLIELCLNDLAKRFENYSVPPQAGIEPFSTSQKDEAAWRSENLRERDD